MSTPIFDATLTATPVANEPGHRTVTELATQPAMWRRAADTAADVSSLLPPNGELVLKRGAEGARVLVGDGGGVAKRYEAYQAPAGGRMVDTIGACDSLAAGYLAARLRGLSIDERFRIGVRNGTASTRAAGGVQAQLTWDAATSA